jgi:hypothetical protein
MMRLDRRGRWIDTRPEHALIARAVLHPFALTMQRSPAESDTLRVSTFLGALLLVSQALALTGAGLAVDTEARLRATAAAGESIVSALTAYRREHGEFPSHLDRLVPRYFSALPVPEYGAHEWEYRLGRDRLVNDERLPVTPDRGMSGSSGPPPQQEFAISVRLDPANPETRFRRLNGCWRLPELPKCW